MNLVCDDILLQWCQFGDCVSNPNAPTARGKLTSQDLTICDRFLSAFILTFILSCSI